jgi:hypothetical protein
MRMRPGPVNLMVIDHGIHIQQHEMAESEGFEPSMGY